MVLFCLWILSWASIKNFGPYMSWYECKSPGEGMGHFPDEDVSSPLQSRDPTDPRQWIIFSNANSPWYEVKLVKTPPGGTFWALDRAFPNHGLVRTGKFPGILGTSLPCGLEDTKDAQQCQGIIGVTSTLESSLCNPHWHFLLSGPVE